MWYMIEQIKSINPETKASACFTWTTGGLNSSKIIYFYIVNTQ